MLNVDLALSNEFQSRKSKKSKSKKKKFTDGEEPAGFHFIAFVPIQGNVWKLDGLEQQPMNLGIYSTNAYLMTSSTNGIRSISRGLDGCCSSTHY
jgi:ubiquitin carboxyl-terminal hydrolase L5